MPDVGPISRGFVAPGELAEIEVGLGRRYKGL